MKKPDTLRAALTAALPELAVDPDKLLVFIEAGSLRSTVAPGLSFEASYTLNLILTDFAGDPVVVWLAILMWARINQSELLDNIDQRAAGIAFDADIISNTSCDLSIKLALSERVIVKQQPDGRLDLSYPDEPQTEALLEATHWSLYLRDQLLAEWDSPAA